MLRILVADDHPVVREGLKEILTETSGMVVAGEASNGQEVLNKVGQSDYDVVLLDISMPGRGGLDTLKELKRLRPRLPVLILSVHSEEQYAIRALQAGACAYLTKECPSVELIAAIRKAALGRKYITSSLAERMASDLEIDARKLPHEALSDREYEVMCMIASGKTVKGIAEELSLSVKTVSTHRCHILGKMKMENNAELTHYAICNRLVD